METLSSSQRGDKYRYTFIDGRYGYVSDPGAHVSCASKAVTVAGADGKPEVWPKAPLRVTNTSFESNGAKLVGQPIEPVGQASDSRGATPSMMWSFSAVVQPVVHLGPLRVVTTTPSRRLHKSFSMRHSARP